MSFLLAVGAGALLGLGLDALGLPLLFVGSLIVLWLAYALAMLMILLDLGYSAVITEVITHFMEGGTDERSAA